MTAAEPQRSFRDQAEESLDLLALVLPAISDDIPGMRRRHSGRGVLSDAELDEQVRAYYERHTAAVLGHNPPGPSRIPVDLTAADLRREITQRLSLLELRVCLALPSAAHVSDSTDIARIERLRAILDRLHEADDLEEQVATETAEIADAAVRAIDPPRLSQLGACPWCGRKSLEVDHEEQTITCKYPWCRCSRDDCGCHRGEPHTVPREQWAAFAQQCRIAEAARETQRMTDELRDWTRRVLAAKETEIRERMFRTGDYTTAQLGQVELARIDAERAAVEEMGDHALRRYAARFDDQPGYREEWR